jgi:hypothetical protein
MSSDRISKNILIYQPKQKRSLGKTSEAIEGFCIVMSTTGLNRPNA